MFHRVNIKGNVFYPKATYDAKGYTTPTTWDELTTLEAKMAADGTPAVVHRRRERLVDRLARSPTGSSRSCSGPSDPMAMTSGSITRSPFNDPTVQTAVQTMMDIWGNPADVYGGTATILQTNFGDAPPFAFSDPPKCWLTNQGNFITIVLPGRRPG